MGILRNEEPVKFWPRSVPSTRKGNLSESSTGTALGFLLSFNFGSFQLIERVQVGLFFISSI